MRRRAYSLVLIVFLLSFTVCQGAIGPYGDGEGGTTTVSKGGGSSLTLDNFIWYLEAWQKEKPDKYDYMQTLLYKEPITTTDYAPPKVRVYYEGNTTVNRTQDLKIRSYIKDENPVEIRRALYLYLEAQEPGMEGYRQVNPSAQIIQTNEYDKAEEGYNYSIRDWPDLTNFRHLKTLGEVDIRIKVTDGKDTWYSGYYYKEDPEDPQSKWMIMSNNTPHYSVLAFTVINNPPQMDNASIIGPDTPRYNDPMEFVANVSDPDGDLMNVSIHILDESGRERRVETQEVIPGSVSFNAARYGFFGEDDAGKNFSHYYTIGDGIEVVRYPSQEGGNATLDGPRIRSSPKLWVEKPSVNAEGNYFWWQEYNFTVYMRNQEPYSIELPVNLYTSTPKHPHKPQGTRTVTVNQDLRPISFSIKQPFDVSDVGQNFTFGFEYPEYDQQNSLFVEGRGVSQINLRIVKYYILTTVMILNLLVVMFSTLAVGVFLERRLKKGGEK